ncbi:MAG: enoyl-ACP reductase [Chloroflexi bacterium]|nr:enoyl-ACP reductase [Chloroflexota bacterium]
MGLFDGKKGIVFGVANKYSIAWGIAKVLAEEGADVGLSYAMPALERRVRPLAEQINARYLVKCDVQNDEEIEAAFEKAKEVFGTIDFLVHAIAYAKREDLDGLFVDTSRDGFHLAMDISVYSLVALTRAAAPLMPNGGSIVTMTYYGSEKVAPRYNVMGVAKAALEASVRYLAYDLGPKGIRVNAISAGPIKTLSAAGVSGFKKLYQYFPKVAPLRKHVTQEDIGHTAAFLLSDWARGITGEVIYVDSGYNILGLTAPLEEI